MFWRKNKPFTREKGIASYSKGKSPDTFDLSRRNGEAIDLKSISLRGTNLSVANLTETQLSGADLSSAILMDVDSYDHWYCVRFDGANLRRAKVDLSYIDKSMPHLKGATLPKGILPPN